MIRTHPLHTVPQTLFMKKMFANTKGNCEQSSTVFLFFKALLKYVRKTLIKILGWKREEFVFFQMLCAFKILFSKRSCFAAACRFLLCSTAIQRFACTFSSTVVCCVILNIGPCAVWRHLVAYPSYI